jgi:hypothetical protein
MRTILALALLLSTGCAEEAVVHHDLAAAPAPKMTPGEWEITTTTAPRPGAPGQPEVQTGTTLLSVEEALDPPVGFFGGDSCEPKPFKVSDGVVSGNMPCRGDGALSNASMTINGTYDRDSFDVTIDTNFMGFTVRQEKRGRHIRTL